MNAFDKLEALYNMYEGFTNNYLLNLAKEKAEYIFRAVRAKEGASAAENFLASYFALLADCDLTVSQEEYDFFVKATKISHLSLNNIKTIASKLRGDYDVKMMYREYRKETDLDVGFDEAMMVFALTVCACDGKISDREQRYITDFVPLPGICD